MSKREDVETERASLHTALDDLRSATEGALGINALRLEARELESRNDATGEAPMKLVEAFKKQEALTELLQLVEDAQVLV